MRILPKIAFATGFTLSLATFSSAAQAYAIYSLNDAVLTNGDTVSGILETNQYDFFGQAQLTLSNPNLPGDPVIETFYYPAPNINPAGTFVEVFDNYNNALFLYFDNSIDGYGPVSLITAESFLCSNSYALDCGGGTYNSPAAAQTFFAPFGQTSANDPLSVPEPGSLWMLIAGLCGLLTFACARIRKAVA